MAKFSFQAKAANGRDMRGEIDAATEVEARVKLRAQRLVPIKVVPKSKTAAAPKGGARVKPKDLQIFTRQLATLISSGVPILQAIDVLGRGARSPGLVFALREIASAISAGRRLGDAVADHPKVFDRFYANMVRAGEESGSLDQILLRQAAYIEKSVKIQGKIKGAMVYPAAIVIVTIGVVSGLLIFVIPGFQKIFADTGQDLPGLTQLVVNMSNFFMSYWWAIFGGLIGAVVALVAYYRSPDGRKVCDRILIDVPVLGDLIQKGGIARFTRTLSTLLASGVDILEALEISSRTVGNWVIERAIMKARDSLTEGKSLTVPFSAEKYMPSMVTQMIGVGEATGNLDSMLGKIADFYEDEVDVAVGALTSLMEPILMVVLGGIVAFFVVAMYLPIFNMAGAVS